MTTPLRIILGLFPVALFTLLPGSPTRAQETTVSETLIAFRTYPFSDPDPVPRMGKIYPYFRFQGYTTVAEERPWKIVTLENSFLRVLIAPELGGKVLGALEKSTGKEFLYFNRVMKFRDVALRGPWTSGGIEFNFGVIGHTPTTATPVDYLTRTNPDGSVSCIVGALDLPSRTEWRVEIRLPAERALFEIRSFWFNPTEQTSSLYHWMNAGVRADSTLEVLYPGTAYITHAGERAAWPIDAEGRDLSYYRNNDFGSYKSYHVLGTFTDFFGARWGDFGVIHWSPYVEKPGKKLWIWGLSREGEIWVNLLTDTDLGNTQYVELQSGIHFNQAIPQSSRTPFKHMQFLPYSSESFTEAWYPFVGLQGVSRATPELALDARVSGATLHFEICPTGELNERIEVMDRGRRVYSRHLALAPLETFEDSVAFKMGADDYEIRIGTLMRYGSAEATTRTLERPTTTPASFDWASATGLALEARELERQRDYEGALRAYRSSLQKDPDFLPSLSGAAELLYRRMQCEEARDLARHALAVDTYDPRANFVYGLAQRELKRPYDARDGFGIAARSRTYRPAAYLQLAEMAFLDSAMNDAARLAERAVLEDGHNISARCLLAVLARLGGDAPRAHARCDDLLEIDPLNHCGRFERYRLEGSAESRDAFTGLIRNELPHETYLELAAYYLQLGLAGEAALVLTLAPDQPMVNFWRAYLADQLSRSDESTAFLKRALSADPALVFPHRRESLAILRWAESQSPGWKTGYYLALLLWHLGRTDEARELLERAGKAPRFAPFYLARASLRSGIPERERVDYERAVEVAPETWRPYHALAHFLNGQGDFADALSVSAEAAGRFPAHGPTQFLHARTLMLNGQYDACLVILDTLNVLPAEGARDGRDVYHQACVLSALERISTGKLSEARALLERARLWPEHLGSGKPYEPDTRTEDYLTAVVYQHQGDVRGADSLREVVAERTRRDASRSTPQHLLGAEALRELGNEDEGRATLQRWLDREPQDAAAQFCFLVFTRQKDRAEALEESLRSSVLQRSTGDQELILMSDLIKAGLLP
jgi:tetratricopeptide (TPR) repeat protein